MRRFFVNYFRTNSQFFKLKTKFTFHNNPAYNMKNYFKKFLLITILAFAANISFTQVNTIGPEQTITYGFSRVLPVGENSFFVQHYDKMTGTKMILTHYSNFIEDATTGPITAEDCSALVVDGKLIVFQNVKTNGIVSLTAQEYGTDCMPVGESKALMSFNLSGSYPKEQISLSVVQSENQEFFASIFKVEHKGKVKFGFKIYNKSFTSIKEGFFDVPYESYILPNPSKYLSNQGNLYFSSLIPVKVKKIMTWVKKIWKLENNTMNEVDLKFDGVSIINPLIYESLDGTLRCAGIVSEKGSTEFELLSATINFTDKLVTLDSRIELPKEFIGFNDLFSYYSIPNMVLHENGNLVLVIDQYASSSKKSTVNGTTDYIPITTYYDTKVLMINKNYEILWTANLGHANQISYFGKYTKTFCLDVKDDELVFYMNLNKTRTGMEIPETFTVAEDHKAEEDNCLGRISVDLETGEIDRKLLCDQLGCNWMSTFTLDEYSNGVIAAFHKGLMKYRFGLMK